MKYIKIYEEHSHFSDIKYLHELGLIDDLQYQEEFCAAWKQGLIQESDLLEEVKKICEKYEITGWKLVNGRVNTTGDVNLVDRSLACLPLLFGLVDGDFYCNANQLTSLEGAPSTVGRNFYCRNNQLTSLEGAPSTVNGDFYCNTNQLTSLEGAPSTVNGDFYCQHNQLTSLEGAPSTVGGNFYCQHNQLTSLEGAPSTVNGHFSCSSNQLTSLDGIGKVKGKIFSDI